LAFVLMWILFNGIQGTMNTHPDGYTVVVEWLTYKQSLGSLRSSGICCRESEWPGAC
jgi:hypothetical protein